VRLEGNERMTTKLTVKDNMPEESQATGISLIVNGCTEIFLGWSTRFGHPMNLFAFPLNKKEHPSL